MIMIDLEVQKKVEEELVLHHFIMTYMMPIYALTYSISQITQLIKGVGTLHGLCTTISANDLYYHKSHIS